MWGPIQNSIFISIALIIFLTNPMSASVLCIHWVRLFYTVYYTSTTLQTRVCEFRSLPWFLLFLWPLCVQKPGMSSCGNQQDFFEYTSSASQSRISIRHWQTAKRGKFWFLAPEYCFLKHRPIFFAFFSIAHRSLGRQSPDLAHVAARRDCHLHPTRIEPQQYSQGSSGDIPFTSLHRTAESAPLSLPRSLLLDSSRACAPLPRGSSPPPRLRRGEGDSLRERRDSERGRGRHGREVWGGRVGGREDGGVWVWAINFFTGYQALPSQSKANRNKIQFISSLRSLFWGSHPSSLYCRSFRSNSAN